MTHVNPFMLLGGALSGTLPNPSLVTDEAGLMIARQVHGPRVVAATTLTGSLAPDDGSLLTAVQVYERSIPRTPTVRAGDVSVTVAQDALGYVLTAAAASPNDADGLIAARMYLPHDTLTLHDIVGPSHLVRGNQYQLVGLTAANTPGLLTPASTVGANQIPIGGAGGAVAWSGVQTFNAGAKVASGQFFDALTDGATGGLRAGASSDVLLYRYAADIWYTPDSFYASGAIQAGIASAGVSSALRLQGDIGGSEFIQAGDSVTDGGASLVICRYGTTSTAINTFNLYAQYAYISGTLELYILKATATANQIVLQSAGVTGTLTWTPTISGKVITLPDATGTAALGTGAATRVAFWSDANTLTSDADMTFVTDTLTVTKINASTSLAVAGGTAYTSISNNPGAAAAILASTTAGALTLEGLTVNGLVTVTVTDAVTAGASDVLVYVHNSTGTPANGFGANMRLQLETDTTPNTAAGLIQAIWATATHASRAARLTFWVYDTGAREGLRVQASGTAPMIGFLGAAAVIRQTLGAAATDPATTQTLANNIRTALINLGLGQT